MRRTDQRGVIGIVGMLAFSSAILVVGTTMVTTTVFNYKISAKRINSTQSYYNAESGAEDALMHIRRDPNYGVSATTLTTDFGGNQSVTTEIEQSAESGCSGRDIIASGYVSTLVRRVKLSNCINQTDVDAQFNYAVQVDAGGVNMNNNSLINGSLYSNGSVQGANGAVVTGTATVAGGVPIDPDPLFDPAGVTDFTFGQNSQPTRIDVAQSFIAADNEKIIRLSVKVKKIGNPANATIRLTADNGNRPATTTLASGTLLTGSVGTNYGFVDVSMTSNPSLTSGTKYWIVIDANGHNSNHWSWASNTSYGPGEGKHSANFSSGSWTDAATDFAFKVWTGGTPNFLNSLVVNGTVKANTINGSTIGGDAYYQTISGSTVSGTSYPGSVDSPSQSMPISDGNIADFKEQAEAGGTWNGDYVLGIGQTATLGPKKITGNLTLDNSATLYLSGPLYVLGTVNLTNNSSVRLVAGFGSNDSALILADGTMDISNNVSIVGNGPNSFIMLITESTVGMNVSNNGASAILVTRKGPMNFSNNAGSNALVAYQLNLSNNATVTYTSGLADVTFVTGPGAKWVPQGWREILLD